MAKAHFLYEDLLQAQNCLVLVNCLHLLYLVTPYDLSEQIKPAPGHYYRIVSVTSMVMDVPTKVASHLLGG